MCRVRSLLTGAVLLAACDGTSPTAPTGETTPVSPAVAAADTSAMQQLVARFDAVWTAGDNITYAAQFMGGDGWEWVGPTGLIHADSVALTGFYKTLFTFVFSGTTRNSTIRKLTFLTGTLAVLDVDARITGFTSLPPTIVPWQPTVVRVLEKNVLVKRGGAWQIIKHQQTSVAPGIP